MYLCFFMSFSACSFPDTMTVLDERNGVTGKLVMYNVHKNNIDECSVIKIIFNNHNQWSNSAIVSTLDIN